MLLNLDGTFLIQMINFVIFWMLLNWLFIAPTRRAIDARLRYIATQYSEADELTSVADTLQAQTEAALDEGRRQTGTIMRETAAEADRIVRSIENAGMEEANAAVQLARATVAAEEARAVETQGPFVEELARTMVERATAIGSAA